MDTLAVLGKKKVRYNFSFSRFSLNVYYGFFAVIILALLILIPLWGNNYLIHIALEMVFLAYMGQAWNIFSGSTGELSFGHAGFFGVGAYTSSLLLVKWGISPWVGMLAGGCIGAALAISVSVVSLRHSIKGVFFALGTLALAEVLRLISLFWVSVTNGARGILVPWSGENYLMFSFGVHKKYLYYYVILGMLVGCTFVAYRIKRIRLGYYLSAIRGNEDAAQMLGISTIKYQSIAMAISGFLTAIGGTFYAQYYQHFEPEVVFGCMRSFEFIFPVVLGGGGNISGPIIGAFVLQFFEEVTRATIPSFLHGFHRMLYGILLMIMIMYLPGGIVSLLQRKIDGIASNYKIRMRG